MLLNLHDFSRYAVIVANAKPGCALAFDFETDGLDPRKGAKAFLMGFCFENGDKFCHSIRVDESTKLAMATMFSNPRIKYLAHNAKFEMGFLKHQFGIEIAGDIWDTEVFARVQYPHHQSYSLQNCAQRIKLSKYGPMLSWLKKNKNKYHEAPEELIVPYVEMDAELSMRLYKHQRMTFVDWQSNSNNPISGVINTEMAVTKALFDMEDRGLLVDMDYCHAALHHESKQVDAHKRAFFDLTGVEFCDSRKTLVPIFDKHGIPYGKTAAGNASFDYDTLYSLRSNPIVASILGHRESVKRLSTYWENFIKFSNNGVIHPNIRQIGAETGRMSVRDPAAQTWPDDPDGIPYPIRKAFIARPDSKLVSIDYAQMELRLMADEAEEFDMIRDIQGGVDFHQRVADSAGVPRNVAKSARFAKLYGAGPAKIAATLGVDVKDAERVIAEINKQSPNIQAYSHTLITRARAGQLTNWYGRRYFINKTYAYIAPNYRIQGGCADILKIAICNLYKLLRDTQSYMILPVHDELLFNIHNDDMHLLPEIRRTMIEAHQNKKHLDMDVSISVGDNYAEGIEV